MKSNKWLQYIGIFLVAVALSYGFDLLMPTMERSPVWHGALIAGGILLLLLAGLLSWVDPALRREPRLAGFAAIGGMVLLGVGLILNGVAFWYPVPEAAWVIAYVAGAIGLLMVVVLQVRARV